MGSPHIPIDAQQRLNEISTSTRICFHYPDINPPGEDTSSQTQGGVIGSMHHLLFSFKRQHRHDRAKDLFLHTGHVISAATCNSNRSESRVTYLKTVLDDSPVHVAKTHCKLHIIYAVGQGAGLSYPKHTESCNILLSVWDLKAQTVHLHTAQKLPSLGDREEFKMWALTRAVRIVGGPPPSYLILCLINKGKDFVPVISTDEGSHSGAL